MAKELLELGIMDPRATEARKSIWEHVFLPRNMAPEEKARRIAEVIEVQEKYLGKQVRKIEEPNGLSGVVQHIKKRSCSYGAPNDHRTGKSPFEAYVKWSKKASSYQNLNFIEVIP